ncbi:MAG: selenocysteine-specific translation elongation factor [Planctomycetes bacterium]|nr:selenocysteine-specific translation elongation factor [Planctomycetota bacterium]
MPRVAPPIVNVVIGTAGHIDHGKSSLVRRLTGIDPDRLPEEKERGLTIDLGFAPCLLKDGRRIGIVDVPGHEKFVKNMVAGATGIDLVLLLVAANDGVMPQTREHLHIMSLLGVKRGIVVVTKIDMVDRELTEVVIEEVRDLVKGSFLETAPLCPISVVTDEGFPHFWDTLNAMVAATPPKSTDGAFRMPVQRVFSAKGFGTVVTGIPLSGRASLGDTVEFLPLGKTGRIRGLQAYKSDVNEVRAGHSSALNVSDVDHNLVVRGFVVATPGYFQARTTVEARLSYLSDFTVPLKTHLPIRFHTGTAEVMGKMILLDRKEASPGEEVLVQFLLEDPVVAAPGDYFVVRHQSPTVTIGGGKIIASLGRKLRRNRAEVLEDLSERERVMTDAEPSVEYAVKASGARALARDPVAHETGLTVERTAELLAALVAKGRLIPIHQGNRFLHVDALAKTREKALASLAAFHAENPLRAGIERIAFRNRLELENEAYDLVLGELLRTAAVVEENAFLRAANFQVRMNDEFRRLSGQLEQLLLETEFNTPRPDELPGLLKATAEKAAQVLRILVESGTIIRLKDDILLHQKAIEKARELLVKQIQEKGEVISGDFRTALATSRKYVIPLLDWFDEQGITVREGSRRVLHPKHRG